jgi:hypothetical protein
MAGFLDDKMRLAAEKILKKFGEDATYIKVSEGTPYNPTIEGSGVPITTETPITIYISSPEYGDIQSGIATATDSIILMSAKESGDLIVEAGDMVRADKTYTVKSNKPIKSGAKIALHNLVCVIT